MSVPHRQVDSGASVGVAGPADCLARVHLVPLGHREAQEVGVADSPPRHSGNCHGSIPGDNARERHRAGAYGSHRRAGLGCEVDPPVAAVPADGGIPVYDRTVDRAAKTDG